MRWEYLIRAVTKEVNEVQLLTALGLSGWELVSVNVMEERNAKILYFKRRLIEFPVVMQNPVDTHV